MNSLVVVAFSAPKRRPSQHKTFSPVISKSVFDCLAERARASKRTPQLLENEARGPPKCGQNGPRGPPEGPLGGPWAPRASLGALLVRSWLLLGASWGAPGGSWGRLGAVLGPLGPLLGPPEPLLGLMLASRGALFGAFEICAVERP